MDAIAKIILTEAEKEKRQKEQIQKDEKTKIYNESEYCIDNKCKGGFVCYNNKCLTQLQYDNINNTTQQNHDYFLTVITISVIICVLLVIIVVYVIYYKEITRFILKMYKEITNFIIKTYKEIKHNIQ